MYEVFVCPCCGRALRPASRIAHCRRHVAEQRMREFTDFTVIVSRQRGIPYHKLARVIRFEVLANPPQGSLKFC